MPHTVRPAGRAISPAASSANVGNDRAVKHGRNSSSSPSSDLGNLSTRSIGGTPSPESYGNRRCFHIQAKITPPPRPPLNRTHVPLKRESRGESHSPSKRPS